MASLVLGFFCASLNPSNNSSPPLSSNPLEAICVALSKRLGLLDYSHELQ